MVASRVPGARDTLKLPVAPVWLPPAMGDPAVSTSAFVVLVTRSAWRVAWAPAKAVIVTRRRPSPVGAVAMPTGGRGVQIAAGSPSAPPELGEGAEAAGGAAA